MSVDHDAARAVAALREAGYSATVADSAGTAVLISTATATALLADVKRLTKARGEAWEAHDDVEVELTADMEWLKGANAKLDAEVQRLTKLTSTCSCDMGPWSTGPEADCSVHGAIQAHAQASKRIAELEAEVRRLEEVNTRAAERIFKLAERQAYGGNPLTLDVPGNTP